MIFEDADLKFANDTLEDFFASVALSRAINERQNNDYALRTAQRAALDDAVVKWSILFGSDHQDHQPIHWKNLFDANDFRSGLLLHVGLSEADWRTYRDGLVTYRNDVAAHRSLAPRPTNYPMFDLALAAADFYHSKLQQKAQLQGKDLRPLVKFSVALGMCRSSLPAT
jgi:hypothetical protein